MVPSVTCAYNNNNSLSLCLPIYLVIYLLDAGSGSLLFYTCFTGGLFILMELLLI